MDFSPKKKKELRGWIVGTVSLCVLIFLAVQNIGLVASAAKWLLDLVSPLLLGFAIAVILNVPMRTVEDALNKLAGTKYAKYERLRRPLAFVLSLVFIFGVVLGVVWLVIPELVGAFAIIAESVADLVNTISAMSVEEIEALPFGKLLLETDWNSALGSLQLWLKNEGGRIAYTAFGTIGSLMGGVVDFFLALIFSIYILFSKDSLKAQLARLVRAWLPERNGEWLIHACAVADVNFRNFISGQSLEAVILGLLCLAGMLILRLPYAPMVSALVGITALIPVVGAFIGAGVGAFMILTVAPVKALVFVAFLLILQQVEGNVIYPRVMSSRVSLPGLWILAAVTVGGGIGGALGMLLGVPVCSTAYVLLREATEERERRLAAAQPSQGQRAKTEKP